MGRAPSPHPPAPSGDRPVSSMAVRLLCSREPCPAPPPPPEACRQPASLLWPSRSCVCGLLPSRPAPVSSDAQQPLRWAVPDPGRACAGRFGCQLGALPPRDRETLTTGELCGRAQGPRPLLSPPLLLVPHRALTTGPRAASQPHFPLAFLAVEWAQRARRCPSCAGHTEARADLSSPARKPGAQDRSRCPPSPPGPARAPAPRPRPRR